MKEAIKTRIYISGGITKVKDYREKFRLKEKELCERGFYHVINPIAIGNALLVRSPQLKKLSESELYSHFMRADIIALLSCTQIYMMEGWMQSNGAKFEHETALICGIDVIYENNRNRNSANAAFWN